MRIAIFQGPAQPGSVAQNLATLDDAAQAAAARGARLLVLPEMFLTGYHIGPDETARLAEPADGPASGQVAAAAAASGLALLYGYPERNRGQVFNSAQLIDRDGRRLANYRKSHLFGDIDRSAFVPGDGAPTTAQLDCMHLGVLICYDVEFPENARLLALAGVDLIVVPTALMHPYEVVARTVVTARAFENQVFVAYANRCGRERELDYCGASCIIGPDGAELARAGNGEALLIADLDRERLRASRQLNTYLRDRRPALYAPLTATPDQIPGTGPTT